MKEMDAEETFHSKIKELCPILPSKFFSHPKSSS